MKYISDGYKNPKIKAVIASEAWQSSAGNYID